MSDTNFLQSLWHDIAALASSGEQQAQHDSKPKLDPMPKLKASTTTNASLWLDKLLHAQLTASPGEYQHPYITHIKAICECGENSDYHEFFRDRWLPSLPVSPNKEKPFQRVAKVTGRLVIGLGSESAWENSITLHRTYGVPYIPGSALKGLAAAYAHKYLAEGVWNKADTDDYGNPIPIGDAHKIMFGDTTSEGYVTFFDALYVPDSGHNHKALWPDVITVHHPEYYSEAKQEGDKDIVPPADWDDPTPIPFVSATGKYLIALAGPEEWVATAFDILALALADMGVGAKTSSGYGRMTLPNLDAARKLLNEGKTQEYNDNKSPELEDVIEKKLPISVDQEIGKAKGENDFSKVVNRVLQLGDTDLIKLAIEKIVIRAKNIELRRFDEKNWYQKLQQYLDEHK